MEESGRYPLCIWPPHCLIASEGNNVIPVLFDALSEWENDSRNNVNYISKGSNILTEHYSAVKAEVIDPSDPSTQINTRFIQTLIDSDKILTLGEAGSHCWKFTMEDLLSEFSDNTCVKKMVILEDGISPVISPFVDFPAIQSQFITDMKNQGMQVAKTTDF